MMSRTRASTSRPAFVRRGCESLADGAAKITTTAATDYVFVGVEKLKFHSADVAFDGIAGAVRVFGDEVHLIVAEGAGTVRYKGFALKAAHSVGIVGKRLG